MHCTLNYTWGGLATTPGIQGCLLDLWAWKNLTAYITEEVLETCVIYDKPCLRSVRGVKEMEGWVTMEEAGDK